MAGNVGEGRLTPTRRRSPSIAREERVTGVVYRKSEPRRSLSPNQEDLRTGQDAKTSPQSESRRDNVEEDDQDGTNGRRGDVVIGDA